MIYGFQQDRGRYRDRPATIDNMMMYDRGGYPRDDREFERGSRIPAPMYLPDKRKPEYDDYYDHVQRGRQSRYNDFDDRYSDPGRKPRPNVHMYGGRGGGRDPYLWRNAV